MKILLGADQHPKNINGAATFTSRLAAGLAAAGHTVDLLRPSPDGRLHTSLDHGVRMHRLSSLALPGRARMQVCTPRVVITLGRTLVRAARAADVPVIATNHFLPENLVPRVCGGADLIVMPGTAELQRLATFEGHYARIVAAPVETAPVETAPALPMAS